MQATIPKEQLTADPAGYNGGSYDLRQQTFCLSMLTCLSFNLTGRTTAAITSKFTGLVENALTSEAGRKLVGKWTLVWGPVVYADAFVGAPAPVNSMFIAVPETNPDQAVLAIAGTNGNSLMGWMIEDFNVRETVAWPYGDTPLQPHVSKGIAYGLEKTLGLTDRRAGMGAGQTAREFLGASSTIKNIIVTGHSLGGALAAVYSLYLEDTRAAWDAARAKTLTCLATAGQTPGDEDFSKYYGERLGGATTRIWNALDAVPHAFTPDLLLQVPGLYEPRIPVQKPVEKLILSLRRETEANRYCNILPATAPFQWPFMTLEEIAGEKYRPFVDFVESVSSLVKRMNPFGTSDIVGSLGFVINALVQHIFPYFGHFGIDEFIKVMSTPPPAPPRAAPEAGSFWQRVGAWWQRLKARFGGRRG